MKQLYASGNCIVNKILTYNDLIVFLKKKTEKQLLPGLCFSEFSLWYSLPHIVYIKKEYACCI